MRCDENVLGDCRIWYGPAEGHHHCRRSTGHDGRHLCACGTQWYVAVADAT